MPYKFRDIKKKLLKLWFKIVRQKGSHVLFSNWILTFPVPNHWNKDITIWVEKTILKLLNMSKDEFDKI
jgi:predicted RNA binding protein YcfA (HicA-like mRNA interferase family)